MGKPCTNSSKSQGQGEGAQGGQKPGARGHRGP